MGLFGIDDRPKASRWKATVESFGLRDFDEIAAQIGRLPTQCVWYVAEEIGGGPGEFIRGYRVTAIDDVAEWKGADPTVIT